LERTLRVTGSTEVAYGVMLRAPYLRGARSRGGPRDFDLILTQLAEPGKKVKEGDVVAVFDNVNMRNRLDDLDAERVNLDGQLKRLFADQAATREAHDQQIRSTRAAMQQASLDLQTAPVRSEIQAQALKLALDEAKATYQALRRETPDFMAGQTAERRTLELQLERLTVETRRAKQNVDHLTVTAPIGGMLVSQQIYRGGSFNEIRAGDELRSGQPYLRIVDVHSMVVEAAASQTDAAELRVDAPARIAFDAFPGLKLPGKVRSVGAMATNRNWRAQYVAEIPLKIEIEGADPRIIPSLSASADLVYATAKAAAIVPLEAVFHEGPDEQPCAYVETASGWERRELELGLTNHLEAAVESGLAEGERVALEEPAQWTDSREGNTLTTSAGP
jgi:biotin carboxyl carrier protein